MHNIVGSLPLAKNALHSPTSTNLGPYFGQYEGPVLCGPVCDEGTQKRGITTEITFTCNYIPGRSGQGSVCA